MGSCCEKDGPEFKKLVGNAMSHVTKSADIKTFYDKWFSKPVPPKHPRRLPHERVAGKLHADPNDIALEKG
jgi:hypothetical protein